MLTEVVSNVECLIRSPSGVVSAGIPPCVAPHQIISGIAGRKTQKQNQESNCSRHGSLADCNNLTNYYLYELFDWGGVGGIGLFSKGASLPPRYIDNCRLCGSVLSYQEVGVEHVASNNFLLFYFGCYLSPSLSIFFNLHTTRRVLSSST